MNGTADKWLWMNDNKKGFTVKSYYDFLLGGEKDDFPWLKLWKAAAPTRTIFFTWCAVKGRILTIDNLKLKGFSIVNRCSLCLRHEETIDHLFIHCSWAADLWSLILSCFEVQMCFPQNLKSFLYAWWGYPVGKRKKKLWNLIPLCLFWMIWKERNRRLFEDIEMSSLRFKSLFLSCLFSWAEGGKEIELSHYLSFIASMK